MRHLVGWEKRTQNEPKTNPIYPCVDSGEAGSKPILPPPKGLQHRAKNCLLKISG